MTLKLLTSQECAQDSDASNENTTSIACLKIPYGVNRVIEAAKSIRHIATDAMSHNCNTKDIFHSMVSMSNAVIHEGIATTVPRCLTNLDLTPPFIEHHAYIDQNEASANHGALGFRDLSVRAWLDETRDVESVVCYVDGSFSAYKYKKIPASGIGIVMVDSDNNPVMAVSASTIARDSYDIETKALRLAKEICRRAGIKITAAYSDNYAVTSAEDHGFPCLHVKGHDGNWWNEIADGLASRGRSRIWESLDKEAIERIITYLSAPASETKQTQEDTPKKVEAPKEPAYSDLAAIKAPLFTFTKAESVPSPILIMSVADQNHEYAVLLFCTKKKNLHQIVAIPSKSSTIDVLVSRLNHQEGRSYFVHKPTACISAAIFKSQILFRNRNRYIEWNGPVPEISIAEIGTILGKQRPSDNKKLGIFCEVKVNLDRYLPNFCKRIQTWDYP